MKAILGVDVLNVLKYVLWSKEEDLEFNLHDLWPVGLMHPFNSFCSKKSSLSFTQYVMLLCDLFSNMLF